MRKKASLCSPNITVITCRKFQLSHEECNTERPQDRETPQYKQPTGTHLCKEVLDRLVELDDEAVDESFACHITLARDGVLLTAQTLKTLGASLQHLYTQ